MKIQRNIIITNYIITINILTTEGLLKLQLNPIDLIAINWYEYNSIDEDLKPPTTKFWKWCKMYWCS
jgi:hypothetical protein